MRTRTVPAAVAVLALVTASCGGSGDSESSPGGGAIEIAASDPPAGTTVAGDDDEAPPATEVAASDSDAPSADDPAPTTELPVPDPDDPTPPPTESAAPGPRVLEPRLLAELSLSGEVVGEVMGAELVEVDDSSIFMMFVGPVPDDAEVDAHDYWSLDSGDRSLGVGSVDYAAVILLLLVAESDVDPMFDRIINAEPDYTRWVPVAIRGAERAERSVAIPYEGEPEDEPEFDAVLARRGTLIVAATVSGSDGDARVETAIALVELVIARAAELSV